MYVYVKMLWSNLWNRIIQRVKIHRLTKPEMLLRRFLPAPSILLDLLSKFNIHAHTHSHCKGHNLCMFQMMCVCIKMFKFSSAHSSLSSFLMQKWKKGEFQLASLTNQWLKAFYMWSTQTQQTTLTDDKKNILYNVPVSLSDESSSIPLQSKHRCYCLVRWFWSSTLHRGINNKRQYSWPNRKSRYFVRKKGGK